MVENVKQVEGLSINQYILSSATGHNSKSREWYWLNCCYSLFIVPWRHGCGTSGQRRGRLAGSTRKTRAKKTRGRARSKCGRKIHTDNKRTKRQPTNLAKGTNQLMPHLSYPGLEFFGNLLVLQSLSVKRMI
jgi:hypothetical protein